MTEFIKCFHELLLGEEKFKFTTSHIMEAITAGSQGCKVIADIICCLLPSIIHDDISKNCKVREGKITWIFFSRVLLKCYWRVFFGLSVIEILGNWGMSRGSRGDCVWQLCMGCFAQGWTHTLTRCHGTFVMVFIEHWILADGGLPA